MSGNDSIPRQIIRQTISNANRDTPPGEITDQIIGNLVHRGFVITKRKTT
jgi:hypothetical protein